MKFQAPKGCRDVYPESMRIREWLFDVWERVSRRNGFEAYDGPIFESLDLYRVKSGEEIVSELFHFQDRGGREFALRPEMTPTLARMVAARANALPKPIRWFSIPRLCRAERPQRGRLREFFQWNIDILGSDEPACDADCAFVMIDFLREVGLTPEQVELRINSRSLLAAILESAGFVPRDMERVYAVLDKRAKVSDDAFAAMVDELKVAPDQSQVLLHLGEARGEAGLEQVRGLFRNSAEGHRAFEQLSDAVKILMDMGVGEYCVFDMGIVRGLAYYTGIVFEAYGKGELNRAICGGGRYDNLLASVGGGAMPAVGFATSDVVMQDVIEEFGLLPEFSATGGLFVIDAEPSCFPRLLRIVSDLRQWGYATTYSYKRQSLVKQLKQAAGRGALRVVIVDAETHVEATVALKDLASGVQKRVSLESLQENPYQPLEA